jgi:hypothetical protein
MLGQRFPNLSILLLLELLSIFLLVSKAEAGAGSEQLTPESTPGRATSSIVATPKWELWGNPYWLNGNICREKGANIICLTFQQAKNNHWSIPSNKSN